MRENSLKLPWQSLEVVSQQQRECAGILSKQGLHLMELKATRQFSTIDMPQAVGMFYDGNPMKIMFIEQRSRHHRIDGKIKLLTWQ